jgi:hypothetical protein
LVHMRMIACAILNLFLSCWQMKVHPQVGTQSAAW